MILYFKKHNINEQISSKEYSIGIKGKKRSYLKRKGFILTTGDNASIFGSIFRVGHADIMYNQKYTIEAVSKGVKRKPNNWNKVKASNGKYIRFVVGDVRKTNARQESKVANWCYKKIGCDYNYDFWNTGTRKKFYCSHLVWAAYKDNYKIDLNTSRFDHRSPSIKKIRIAVAPAELLSATNIKKKKVRILYYKFHSKR